VTIKHASILLSLNQIFEQGLTTLPDQSDMLDLFGATFDNPVQLLSARGKATLARYYSEHLAQDRQYSYALSVVERALTYNPVDMHAIVLKAEILVITERYQLAQEQVETLLQSEPKLSQSLLGRLNSLRDKIDTVRVTYTE